jgi:YD repeat-containing protein
LVSGTTEIIIFKQKTDTITYITSPEGLTAIVVASSNTEGREWYWVFTDHLGSITSLVRNSDGQKYEMSYDAWGNRRDPNTWRAFTTTAPEPLFDRGFTGHEHLTNPEQSLPPFRSKVYQ